jgi:hypothetical protein
MNISTTGSHKKEKNKIKKQQVKPVASRVNSQIDPTSGGR